MYKNSRTAVSRAVQGRNNLNLQSLQTCHKVELCFFLLFKESYLLLPEPSNCLLKKKYCVYIYMYTHTHKWAELECISLFLWSSPNAECCHLLLISPPHVGCLGDTQFCFRFRRSSGRKASLCCFLDHLDRDLPVYLKVGNKGLKVILVRVCVYIYMFLYIYKSCSE